MIPARFQSHFEKILVGLFLVIIYVPSMKMMLPQQTEWSKEEKRQLAKLPASPRSLLELKDFFAEVEAYLSDHFGYREFLIKRYHREMKKRFGKIGNESKTLLGEKGWYFYAAENSLDDFMGKLKVSEKQLDSWASERERRAMWCKQRGIKYFLIIPPNKSSIYPELVLRNRPPISNTAQYKGSTLYEQLIDYKKNSPLPFLLDLHQPLRDAKSNGVDLYYKTDSHWNLRGAYTAFVTLHEAVQKSFPDVDFTKDFTFGPDVVKPCDGNPDLCDLARIAMQDKEETITCPTLANFTPCSQPGDFAIYGFSSLPQREESTVLARQCEKRQLNALVFRDSFMVALEPFFSENFRHTIYLWKKYDQKNIEEALNIHQIDVVIEEIVERFFSNEIYDL